MTTAVTVRLPQGLLDRAEARAARLGLDRSKYLRSLIEQDLSAPEPAEVQRFASEDLVGIFRHGQKTSATNARVREQLRARVARPRR